MTLTIPFWLVVVLGFVVGLVVTFFTLFGMWMFWQMSKVRGW